MNPDLQMVVDFIDRELEAFRQSVGWQFADGRLAAYRLVKDFILEEVAPAAVSTAKQGGE